MLGKTNIMALAEGGIVTEVEDYRWIQMQSGTYGNFVKAIYKGGYLVAITAGGTVVYTEDGEVWNTVVLEYQNCKLDDIDWDGQQFILVGSYADGTVDAALCLTTEHFDDFVKRDFTNPIKAIGFSYLEFCCIFPEDGNHLLVARYDRGMALVNTVDFTLGGTTEKTWKYIMTGTFSAQIKTSKSSNGGLMYVFSSSSYDRGIYRKVDGSFKEVAISSNYNDFNAVSVFECKDILYFLHLQSSQNYSLNKVTDSNEVLTMCTGQNFEFVDGVYFDECQLFINNHSMLVVKKGESIADKTVDDLIEIAPELTMTCITKAFGQLFIFGNQGLILKSSVETGNEEGIAVQALSAKKALADARAYTDARYAELEARIEALEA